ncbi:regulator of G-protein signaling 20 isoform X1 [Physeter macrocephalus]|uniref:Regulator of G-protein signaling 20 isoform X1 n=1 Tax=Physeter macrocephalus TaxID=9755 RepID=A0A2Y9SX96_PHYMC|nr:regulator of G-protein signaling 20 isoform X1 [Physeter catodon]|eukprot:XP_023982828.1 regulator of G-protein signaling 20 isoform X1 [Physeter catodon]
MPRLSPDNQEDLQKHFSRPSTQIQFLLPPRAEDYNANIHQTVENEGGTMARHNVKVRPPAQLPGSPAAPKLLGLLSGTLSGLARFFAHLLQRPLPGAPLRRPDFSLLPPVLPAAGLAPGQEERPGRLSLLLRAALALPGRPPGGRPSREEDAGAGQSSPRPPMGSEPMEMRKRQVCAAQGPAASAPGQHGVGNRGSNARCFCWCCCCSCSCLTVRNQEEQRVRNASYELRTEDLPTCEESPGPTLQEASAWAQSFDALMLTAAGRNAFREFLRTEFSEENMLFWMACEELKKEAHKTMIEEKARIIYEDYVSILSPKEVSLDSRVRETINRSMAEPSPHIFDDAQLQIYTLMHRDSYPRFMNSALYKDLLRSLSEKAVEA